MYKLYIKKWIFKVIFGNIYIYILNNWYGILIFAKIQFLLQRMKQSQAKIKTNFNNMHSNRFTFLINYINCNNLYFLFYDM